ncbi:unnamed protein product [Mytilus edulis]|uniref:Integrase catalytic domain-containing protein n=1 Tax=Mytilus edulis TaxID=6550 RepID=A0A8S3VBI9_MYTED|nr:unnamed protein product [Mytilus edulis]
MCHDHSGHQGLNKTVNKITERYYWKGIVSDTKQYVQQCTICQKQNKKAKTAVPELTSVPIGRRVWGKIGIDLIGPFLTPQKQPLSSNGYRYVLTMVDYLSKWPEAVPIYSKSSSEVASKLADTIFRFGPPDEVISDCGGEFNSKVLGHMFKDYNIKHITTSPYHPQSNGLVENFNGTLKTMINKLVDKEPEKWDLFINEALFAYRVGIHDSTKVSPFEAMYARKPILINEKGIGPTVQPNEINEEIVDELVARRKIIENKIKENVQIAQKRQKVNYDKRHNVSDQTYEEGQQVLLKNFRRKAGLATVQQLRYQGPYVIKQYCGKGNYMLSNGGKDVGPHNQKNLKVWYQPDANNNKDDEYDDDNDNDCENQMEDDYDDDGENQMEDDNLETACTNVNLVNDSAIMNKSLVTEVEVHHVNYSDSDADVPSGQANFVLTDDMSSEESLNTYFNLSTLSNTSVVNTSVDHDRIDILESGQVETSTPVQRKSKRAKMSTKRQSFIYEYYD